MVNCFALRKRPDSMSCLPPTPTFSSSKTWKAGNWRSTKCASTATLTAHRCRPALCSALGIDFLGRCVRVVWRRQRTMLDAFRREELNLRLLMRHFLACLRHYDQRLGPIRRIKRALKRLRLYAALLAGVFRQCRLQHLRLPMQLVRYGRRHHRNEHWRWRLDLDAY